MLSWDDVQSIRDELGDRMVLSVYVSAEEHDPARRSAWRARLGALLDRAAAGIAEDGDRRVFSAARARLEAELRPFTGFLPGSGWAAFATADGVHVRGQMPAPAPDLARWRRGPVLYPFLRSLKQLRPVVVALVDSRRARVFTYASGSASEVLDMRADSYIDDLSDRNTSKRAVTHTGVRGETGTDAAQRILRVERERLVREVAEAVLRLAGEDGSVVVGGPTEAMAALNPLLETALEGRLAEDPSLHVLMREAEVRTATERMASLLTAQRHSALVEDVIEQAGASGRGCMGVLATQRAVAAGQVERLVVTPRFAREHEDDLELLILQTLDRAGSIEELAGEAAKRLDALGEGVGARLRFVRNRPHLAASLERQG